MPVYNVSAIVVDLVEAPTAQAAQAKLVNYLRLNTDGDVSAPDEWSYLPGEAFESEPLPEGTPVLR